MERVTFDSLLRRPPILEIKSGAREVIFTTVSCMCDNVHTIRFKRHDGGDFAMNGNGSHLGNWQFKYKVYEIEWAADEENWAKVVEMINSGTSRISKVVSR